ncbi:hypothetical protein ACQU0X_23135 [Pseudovibrio ascidiaceicola]
MRNHYLDRLFMWNGIPKNFLDGDVRRPDIETEALSWYIKAGLP